MNISTKTMLGAALLAMTAGNAAAKENVYLVKGDRVVAKYPVENVDYITFRLPEGVIDTPVWIDIDRVGKNTVTYTVNTQSDDTMYAHGILSYYLCEYTALDVYSMSWDDITEEERLALLEMLLPYVGYLGLGGGSYTMTDMQNDGMGGLFSVVPGTPYIVCAWELDPATQQPLADPPVYTGFDTLAPGESQVQFEVQSVGQNDKGLAFDFTIGQDAVSVMTCYGLKDVMDSYAERFGMDYLMGLFAQTYTPGDLETYVGADGTADYPTWPVYDTADYVLLCRMYDSEGNMREARVEARGEEVKAEGPRIDILSKSKTDGNPGSVSVSFEITPSNVDEAYVRMLPMNDVDDRLNDGYELWEIATMGETYDITSEINRLGEYTFTDRNVSEHWQSILIYARDNDGIRITQRIDFNTAEGAEWYIADPVTRAPRKLRIPMRNGRVGRKFTFNKVN